MGVDSDGVADVPWHFGTDAQYPVLSLAVDGDGRATWSEVGRQLRAGPTVTAAAAVDPAQVILTWTTVAARESTPSPEVTYTVTREAGAPMETVATAAIMTSSSSLRYIVKSRSPSARIDE